MLSIISFSSLVGWDVVIALSDTLYGVAHISETKSLKNPSVNTGHCAFLKSKVTFGFPILFY